MKRKRSKRTPNPDPSVPSRTAAHQLISDEVMLDQALEMTFPASDPIAVMLDRIEVDSDRHD